MRIPIWLKTAISQIGIDERKDKDVIAEYLKSCNLKYDKSLPWCAAFVAWTLRESGLLYLQSAHARDWLDYGQRITLPSMGDMVVLWRGARTGQSGHVGFYIGFDNDYYYILGGNQSDKVMISPFEKGQLLGARRPITNSVVSGR